MELFVKSVIFLGLIAFTTQDLGGKKGCDCSLCNGINNRIHPIVENKFDEGGKPGCSICEKKKEMLRMERERQKQLQKCPFEILGSAPIKGKTSEEIFDQFREMIIPSQNGFFDMMRGIVKTMHVSSEADLKEAKEKETRELAKKKAEEAEARKFRGRSRKNEKVESPKVTVVLKQKPCGQFMVPEERVEAPVIPFLRRLREEANKWHPPAVEERTPDEQLINQMAREYPGLNGESQQLYRDLLVSEPIMTDIPGRISAITEEDKDIRELLNDIELSTESPLIKFMSNEEFKSLSEKEETEGLRELLNNVEITTESPLVKFMSNEEFKALSKKEKNPDYLELQMNEPATLPKWDPQEELNIDENLILSDTKK